MAETANGNSSRHPFHKDRCLSFIKKMWDADTLGMFRHPVSATEVPGYYEVIETPMDLSTMRSRVEKGEYVDDAAVQDDAALMITNALHFNETGSQWHEMAQQFRKSYLSYAKESGMTVEDDCAYIPLKRARDDESTLRDAELKRVEELGAVLDALEKDKEIPLEELRAKYRRKTEVEDNPKSDGEPGSTSDECSSEEEEDDDEDEDEDSVSDDSSFEESSSASEGKP